MIRLFLVFYQGFAGYNEYLFELKILVKEILQLKIYFRGA